MTTEDIGDLYNKSSDVHQDMQTTLSACINGRSELQVIKSIYFINNTLTNHEELASFIVYFLFYLG